MEKEGGLISPSTYRAVAVAAPGKIAEGIKLSTHTPLDMNGFMGYFRKT